MKNFYALIKLLRIHQWTKNILLFLPLLLAHHFTNINQILSVSYGFLVFSLGASTLYIFNDLLDIEADKNHPRKKHRPLANGDISTNVAYFIMIFTGSVAYLLASKAPKYFFLTLSIYMLISFLYSFKLKQKPIIDIVLLSVLYTIRILAGGYIANIYVSEWLLILALFFFFSLACIKRYSEILLMDNQIAKNKRRGYLISDKELILMLGVASALLSVLVFALYITSTSVIALYNYPRMLLIICPLLLYWVSRIWLLATKGKVVDDPLLFVLRDKGSYITGMIAFLILSLAI